MRRLDHSIITLLGAAALVGCSPTATLALRGEAPRQGRIIGGDAETVRVDPGGGAPAYAIPRSAIEDIDHPGNGAMVTGAALGAVGLGAGVVGGLGAASSQGEAFLGGLIVMGVGALLLTGGILTAYDGYARWTASTDAAAPGQGSPPTVTLTPAGVRITF